VSAPDQPAVSPAIADRPWIATEDVMTEVRARVRAEVRARLARGGVKAFEDEAVFQAVEQLFARALDQRDRQQLLLPELLDDEDDWRVNPSLRLASHRPIAGRTVIWLKQKLLLPLTRWLYDYSRENFARQERLNFVLMACVQELVVENVRLAARVDALEHGRETSPATSRTEPT
jgi:hypothetical protein